MTAIASLLDRCAELKRELLEFSWQPRFDRDRREALRDHFPDRFVGDESELIAALDYFLLQKSDRAAIHRTAYEMAMRPPASAFRNPDKLARAQELQKAEHDRFVQFFGADFVVIPGAQLTERMRSFYTFCGDQAMAELAACGKQPTTVPFDGPYTLRIWSPRIRSRSPTTRSRAWAYAPTSGRSRRCLRTRACFDMRIIADMMRDYLDDDTVSPLLFVRMAARDPERTNQVFRKLLGRKHFDCAIDGEKLMRRCKPDYFDQRRWPCIVPISDRLEPYAAGA